MLLGAVIAASARGQGTLTTATPGAPVPDAWGVTLPLWISAPWVSDKEGWDSDIYGVSNNLAGHAPIANISSWYNTVSAGVTLNLLAAAGPRDGDFLKIVTLAYEGDYTQYEAAAREDNLRNNLTLEASGNDGPWSFSIDNPLLYVDGSKEDEFFNQYNNLGYAVVRERRNQIQERNISFVRYDFANWFVRAVDSATYYNLLIDEHNPVGAYKGYTNWVNRDDMNTGLDLGLKLTSNFAFLAGWRLGTQTQAATPYSPIATDSTYNRALFGFEGQLFKGLQAKLLAGPDYRRYSNAAHSGLNGKDHTWFFLNGQLTETLTPQDSLTATERVWHFVSSSGVSSIQETSENVAYQHVFSSDLSASVGLKVLGHRYDAPQVRNDWTESVPVDVTYALTRGLSLSADYSATTGHSRLPIASTPGQSFEDNLVSLTLKAAF
jgi:hypothetical protein